MFGIEIKAKNDTRTIRYTYSVRPGFVNNAVGFDTTESGKLVILEFQSSDFGIVGWKQGGELIRAVGWESENELGAVSYLSKNYAVAMASQNTSETVADKILKDCLKRFDYHPLEEWVRAFLHDDDVTLSLDDLTEMGRSIELDLPAAVAEFEENQNAPEPEPPPLRKPKLPKDDDLTPRHLELLLLYIIQSSYDIRQTDLARLLVALPDVEKDPEKFAELKEIIEYVLVAKYEGKPNLKKLKKYRKRLESLATSPA